MKAGKSITRSYGKTGRPRGLLGLKRSSSTSGDRGVPLPDAIIEEVGRLARKIEVELKDLAAADVAAAALVEAPLYRRGEELMPWQRAFVEMFLQHRDNYKNARLLLADEVGVGKTLSVGNRSNGRLPARGRARTDSYARDPLPAVAG